MTTIIFPENTENSKFSTMNLFGCPLLTSLQNIELIQLTADFVARANQLNIDFKFGYNLFIPRLMDIRDNGLSQEMVDLNIDNIYQNRTKWTGPTKRLFIEGDNAVPSGTYQPPSGFVEGSEDGNPISAKEQAYVLEKNYGFIIKTN